MSKFEYVQTNFTAGEITPRTRGRLDFENFYNGAATITNYVVSPHGGITRRTGTRFVAEVADSSDYTRLLPFQFSLTQAYVIEAGDQYFRFFRDEGRIEVADTDAAISNGTDITDLTDWDDESTGSAEIQAGEVQEQIAQGLGTAIGDFTANGGLAAAFDGQTSETAANSAGKDNSTTGFIGKNWGAGNTKTITGFKIYSSNDTGFINGTPSTTITITLQGSSDNFVSDVNNLGNAADTDADTLITITKLSGLTETTAYQYHRLRVQHTGDGNDDIRVSEVEFFEDNPVPLTGLNLVGNGSDIAWAQQDVTTSDTGTEHTLTFRVIGQIDESVLLSIGNTSTGGELINEVEYGIGWHTVSFTPTVSPFYVQFKNPNNYTVGVDDIIFLDDAPLSAVTPYTSADLPFVTHTQSADIMFLASPDFRTRELRRLSDTDWSLVEFENRDGPYMDVNVTETTLDPDGTGDSVTFTASSTVGINDDAGFMSTDIGRSLRWQDGAGDWHWYMITAVTDSTTFDADLKSDPTPSAHAATAEWRLGSWSDTTGWPRAIVFFRERLWFAGTDTEPQTIWSSNTADFDNFAPSDADGTVTDTHAITVTASSNQVNAILWLTNTSQGLLAGTSGSEVVVRASSTSSGIAPDNVEVVFQTNVGSEETTAPVKVGHSVLFIQRAGKTLNEILFDFDLDGYSVRDASILSEHLVRPGIADLAYQQNPDKTVWMDSMDGRLVGLSFEREQKVFGWHKHILGGSFDGGEVVVESTAVMPEPTEDQLWLIVKRTVDGNTKRYVEFIESAYNDQSDDLEDAFFVDSGLSGTDGGGATVWSGLDHLEGETVAILADGVVLDTEVVSGGSVTIDDPANTIHIGLPYTSTVTTIPIEAGLQNDTTIGKLKSAPRAFVRFLNALSARISQQGSTIDTIPFDAALFTGTKEVSLSRSRDYELQVTVEQTDPTPGTIINIMVEMEFA